MISIITGEYIYENVNTTFCKALKSGKKSIIGRPLAEIWGDETFRNNIKDKIDKCLSGKSVRYKAAFKTPGWGYGIFQINLRPVRAVPGKITHICAETLNITDFENLKREMNKSRKELLLMKSDYENFFRHKERIADKGIETEGLVHDFNNLIAAVSGYAQLLNDELPGDSPMADKVKKIIQVTERARGLSERMLGTGDRADEMKNPVNINALLGEAVEMVRNLYSQGIIYKIRIPEEEYLVETDPGELLRVFHNLLTNAVGSMKMKGGTLSVSSDIVDYDRSSGLQGIEQKFKKVIHVNISDTGYGIDRSHISKIFDPYYSRSPAARGSGLGLYIVKNILDELSGQIYVSGRKNRGTSIDIYLHGCCKSQDSAEKDG